MGIILEHRTVVILTAVILRYRTTSYLWCTVVVVLSYFNSSTVIRWGEHRVSSEGESWRVELWYWRKYWSCRVSTLDANSCSLPCWCGGLHRSCITDRVLLCVRVCVCACVCCGDAGIAPVCGCGRRVVTPCRPPAALCLASAWLVRLPACLSPRRLVHHPPPPPLHLLVAQRGDLRCPRGALLPGGSCVGVAAGAAGAAGLVGGAHPPPRCPLGHTLVPLPLTWCPRGRGLTLWAEGRFPHDGRSGEAPLKAPRSYKQQQ